MSHKHYEPIIIPLIDINIYIIYIATNFPLIDIN